MLFRSRRLVVYTIFSVSWPSAHPTSLKYTFIWASHSRSLALSPLNISGSLILGLLVFPSIVGWAGPVLSTGVTEPLGCPGRLMVFLLVWAGEAVSSEPAGDGGSGVSGLEALAGSRVWSSASPKSEMLISLSVRSISPSPSRGVAILFYLLGAA